MKKSTIRDRTRILLLLGRSLLVLIFLAGTLAGVYFVKDRLYGTTHFQLRALEYEGARNFDAEAFETMFSGLFEESLLALDLSRVRRLVESDVWVKSALVRRQLPDRLVIRIEERRPRAVAAIESELYVVDEEGVILDLFGSDYADLTLPIVKGLRNLAREKALHENSRRMSAYLQAIQELQTDRRDYTRSISEIDVSNPERVAVIPEEEPVPVYLGGELFLERYETFLGQKELYWKLKEKYGSIEYVDVTYEDKIIFHTPNQSVAG